MHSSGSTPPTLPEIHPAPGRKKKKWILAGGVLVLIVGGLGIHSYSKAKAAKEKMAAMSQVETTQVTRQDLVEVRLDKMQR